MYTKHKYQSGFENVLNLIINGLPSIYLSKNHKVFIFAVLNLIINGLPSI